MTYVSRADIGARMTSGLDKLADEIEAGRGDQLSEHDRRTGTLRLRQRQAKAAALKGGGAK